MEEKVTTLVIQAPNSQVLMADEWSAKFPTPFRRPLSNTHDAILIGTLMWQDGPTTIRIASGRAIETAMSPDLKVAFEGTIDTPSRALVLRNVFWDQYLRLPVSRTSTRVRVAVNDEREPDLIEIEVWEQ